MRVFPVFFFYFFFSFFFFSLYFPIIGQEVPKNAFSFLKNLFEKFVQLARSGSH
jgi:hypothetical protein